MARGLIVLAAGLCLGGCARSHETTLRDGRAALYEWRTLTTDVAARVPSVVSGAEAALRARGYTITRLETSEDRGVVAGEPGGGGDRVVVRAWVIAEATRVGVTVEPWGGEDTARAVLDDVLRRVGL